MKYPTTTITSIDTNIYTTNATFYWSTAWNRDIELYPNGEGVIMANETFVQANPVGNITLGTTPSTQTVSETVTAGVTIKSPDAYYIYDRIRIMTANAIADANGEVVCVTDIVVGEADVVETRTLELSSDYTSTPLYTLTRTETLYESTSGFVEPVTTYITTIVQSNGVASSYTSTYTTDERTTYLDVNTKLHEYFFETATVTQAGIDIALESPFFYYPERGNLPKLSDQEAVLPWENCAGRGPPLVNYGYPPHEVCALIPHKVSRMLTKTS